MVTLTSELSSEYENLFEECLVNDDKLEAVDNVINKIIVNHDRYEAVAKKFGEMPWYFVAVIHNMESSLSFTKHLHNGDPLTARTKHEPKGYPQTGEPPFIWEESAEDALKLKKLGQWTDWSTAGLLYQLERYNGFGYRNYHSETKTPYLWSFSNQYISGKYVEDGKYDPDAVSKQCGAATILCRMFDRGMIAGF